VVRTKELSATDPEQQQLTVIEALNTAFGEVRRESLQSVGPTVSAEATRSAMIAVAGASLAILFYLTAAFRRAPNPFRYGVCAVIAMLHDVLVVLSVAAILGYFIGLEVDAYFLTALLTIISFSVHDTIVVFDRIRENQLRRRAGESYADIVNHSIVQTLPRSLNTQLTSMFTIVRRCQHPKPGHHHARRLVERYLLVHLQRGPVVGRLGEPRVAHMVPSVS
jgi:preprotein translocase subunit SecF